MLDDESFLRNLHHVLLEIHVEQGALICPESGRRYAIKKGIVNMLLMEDECWIIESSSLFFFFFFCTVRERRNELFKNQQEN